MTGRRYDAIVVGARCAGSPTAMLLARQGYRVLLLDRARFPSDTVSTHLIHAPGVAALDRWGLLDRLVATGCPAISTYCFDTGPSRFQAGPRPLRPPRAVLLVGPISGPAAVKITANLVRSGLRPVALTVAEMPCRRRSAGRRLGVKGAGRLCRALPR